MARKNTVRFRIEGDGERERKRERERTLKNYRKKESLSL